VGFRLAIMPLDEIRIGDFLRSLKNHWIALMGGGALVVLVGFSERVTGLIAPRWLFVTVVILLVVYASYLVWKDERIKLASANAAWIKNEQSS
jgi:hypothetical protein